MMTVEIYDYKITYVNFVYNRVDKKIVSQEIDLSISKLIKN